MNPLLRTPSLPIDDRRNKYETLGLTENPFPAEPALVVKSKDPRLNGAIYSSELHAEKAKELRRLLIPASDRLDVKPIAFLMDHATRRGRGIGKSAFLKNQQDAILKDFGEEASEGSAVIFAAYIVITATPSCRKFSEFCRLIAESLCEQGVITQAIWRLRAMSGVIPPDVLDKIGGCDEWENTIGSDSWLEKQNVDVFFTLNQSVRNQLAEIGIRDEVIENLAIHGSRIDDLRKTWLSNKTDSFWRTEGGDLVFGDFVKLFMAAKFTRGLLLIDEVEKMVYHQNLQERRAFVESLRYYMMDGSGSENARHRFYGMLLTVHPGVQEILLSHWNAAGLDRLAPLNEPEAQAVTLYFSALNEAMAKPLVQVYLDHFRLNPMDEGKIDPFTSDAIVEALTKCMCIPGRTLNLLYRVVEKAVSIGITKIDRDFVNSVHETPDRTESEQISNPGVLPAAKTRLSE